MSRQMTLVSANRIKITATTVTMAAPPPEAKPLPSPPTDGITALSFIPESNILASTSWDGCVRMHDADAMSPLLCQTPESGPLLSLATPVAHADTLLAGGMDGSGK
jgi:hypothetical protein